MENAFSGDFYIMPGTIGNDICNGVSVDLTLLASAVTSKSAFKVTAGSDLTIDGKDSGGWEDSNLVTHPTMVDYTGKASLSIPAADPNKDAIMAFSGTECTIIVVDSDNDQAAVVKKIIPVLLPVSKIGSLQLVDLSFKFKQGVKPVNPKYRIVPTSA